MSSTIRLIKKVGRDEKGCKIDVDRRPTGKEQSGRRRPNKKDVFLISKKMIFFKILSFKGTFGIFKQTMTLCSGSKQVL